MVNMRNKNNCAGIIGQPLATEPKTSAGVFKKKQKPQKWLLNSLMRETEKRQNRRSRPQKYLQNVAPEVFVRRGPTGSTVEATSMQVEVGLATLKAAVPAQGCAATGISRPKVSPLQSTPAVTQNGNGDDPSQLLQQSFAGNSFHKQQLIMPLPKAQGFVDVIQSGWVDQGTSPCLSCSSGVAGPQHVALHQTQLMGVAPLHTAPPVVLHTHSEMTGGDTGMSCTYLHEHNSTGANSMSDRSDGCVASCGFDIFQQFKHDGGDEGCGALCSSVHAEELLMDWACCDTRMHHELDDCSFGYASAAVRDVQHVQHSSTDIIKTECSACESDSDSKMNAIDVCTLLQEPFSSFISDDVGGVATPLALDMCNDVGAMDFADSWGALAGALVEDVLTNCGDIL